jgi:hypothetical protein
MFNILYKGKKIYTNVDHDEVAEILDELSEQYYDCGNYEPSEMELEKI